MADTDHKGYWAMSDSSESTAIDSTTTESMMVQNEASVYQIRLEGYLDEQWMSWLDGFTISQQENGETLLTGPILDQAALHGLFKKTRDLDMPLLSVNRLDASS